MHGAGLSRLCSAAYLMQHSERPRQRKGFAAGCPQQYTVSNQGAITFWGSHIFHAFTLSDLQEQLPFFNEESVQPAESCPLLEMLYSSLMQNNIHLGWRHTSALYRERNWESTVGEEEGGSRQEGIPRNHAATRSMLTDFISFFAKKKKPTHS